MSRLHPDFLQLLACPVADCRGALQETGEHLVCQSCQRQYQLENNWPVLIPDEANQPADREA